jgi:hypothetical protein
MPDQWEYCPYCGSPSLATGKPSEDVLLQCSYCFQPFSVTIPCPPDSAPPAPTHTHMTVPIPLADDLERLVAGIPPEEAEALRRILAVLAEARSFHPPRSDGPASLQLFVPACRDLLEHLRLVESEIEKALLALLAEHGLAGEFRAGVPVAVEYVTAAGERNEGETHPDCVHRRLPIAIYADGAPFHSSVLARERDRGVDDALEARGWHVLRFTGRQLMYRPAQCLEPIRRAMERFRQY